MSPEELDQRLRQRAEAALAASSDDDSRSGVLDTDALLHELDVHRIELQTQNEELRQAQIECGELFDLARIGFAIVDRRGVIERANPAAHRLLGAGSQLMQGRPLQAFVEERDADRLSLTLRRAIDGGPRASCEIVLGSDGGEVPVLVDARFCPEDDVCRCTLIDLSEIRRVERQHGALQAQSEVLLDTVADAVVGCDADGCIDAFNKAAERLFGYSAAEVLGKNVGLLMPEPHRSAHDGYIQRFLQTGEARVVGKPAREVEALRKDGTRVEVEIGIGVHEYRGETKFTAVLHDLTARKRAEAERAALARQLHRSQRFEALGTLAAGVAHDFNNLLMAIRGCAEIAHDLLGADTPASVYLEQIQRAAGSGATISRKLMTFAREGRERPTVLQLERMVDDTIALLEPLLAEDVALELQLDADESRVRVPRPQLEQVLVNLVVNACDAMPSGGTLRIATRGETLDPDNRDGLPAGRYAALSVSDDGSGISEHDLEQIFHPFFTTKSNGQGSGLGLALVHGTVTRAGGSVRVDSGLGEGTTFEVLLPQVFAPLSVESSDEGEPREGGRAGVVLVVEDDDAVRMVMRAYLERGGHRVLSARSASEGLEHCRREGAALDVLISDVVLRGVGGTQLARRAREIVPGLPVIYVSGYSRTRLEQQGRIDPGARTLQKPFSAERLLAGVRQAITEKDAR